MASNTKTKPGPKATIPKLERVVVKSISIRPALYKKLENIATSSGISVSALVSELIIQQIGT